MKIIVGLGNPGFRYRNTRHNAGFMVLKTLASRHRLGIRKKGFGGVYGIGRISSSEVMLFEPLTYMNLSGEAVNAVCSAKLKDKKDLLIVSDDINLPLGEIRLRENGSAGGHNGLGSVIDRMGQDLARLRVGIGGAKPGEDMSSYVLSPFLRSEKAALSETLDKAAECAEAWVKKGAREAANLHN